MAIPSAQRYFKFMNSEHVDRILLDGTVLLRSLSYFRNLEASEGSWIGDRLEASSELYIDHFSTDKVTPEEQRLLSDVRFAGERSVVGVHVEGGGTLSNIRVTWNIPNDCFIFCASIGELHSLTDAMCPKAAVSYDACLEISHIDLLAHRIFHRGRVVESGLVSMSAIFEQPRIGIVEYRKVITELGEGQAPPPSMYVKDTRFSPQSEIRIAFKARTASLPDTLTVKIPNPRQLFSECFRDFKRA